MAPLQSGKSVRLLTFKETATLLEHATEETWTDLGARVLWTDLSERRLSAKQCREFIALNTKLFGPGKNEL